MIPRYSLPEMTAVWEPSARFRHWLKVELLAVEAWAALGIVPEKDLATIKERVREVDPERVDEIEKVTNHDVIAFLTAMGENIGPASRWIHYGMTSSDLLDTAFALQMVEACDILIERHRKLVSSLKRRAFEFRNAICVGRTHGVHAEPTTFGLKLAVWAFEVHRNMLRLTNAQEVIRVGKIAGAVGTYATVDPFVEEYVCRELSLSPEDAATQVIQRDRHAVLVARCGIAAATLEKIATEIRHLQRTEVREVEEPFGKGQKGSSAMPHKRNPIVCERISGLARVVRGYVAPSLENMVLWHERDISHSSVERVMLPDVTIALDYITKLTTDVIDGMRVDTDRMRANLDSTGGLVYSQAVLLALTQSGMTREAAYENVQRAAMKTWEQGTPFKTTLLAEPEVTSVLDAAALDGIMDPSRYLTHVDTIFKRLEAIE